MNDNEAIKKQNHLYCLPEQAKPHQGAGGRGGGKAEADPLDVARPNRQTTKRKF